jgi:PAS domain S-box-containing protein
MDLWVTIAILVLVVTYHMSVQLVDGVQQVIDPEVAAQIANALFIWLIGLLWIAYQRWRKIMRRGFMLEEIFLSTGQEVLMVVNADGKIEVCNDAAEPVFGYEAADLTGLPLSEILGDRRRDEEKEEALEKLEASYTRLRELEIHRDSLIHMVCHDMKAPLQVLILQLDLLKEMIIEKLDNDELESVDTLLAYSRQLEIMVHSMLDLSKLEAGALPLRLKPHDISESINESVQFLKSMRSKFEVTKETNECARSVPFDRDIVQRVLLNLLMNATKYSPPEGKVSINVCVEGEFLRLSVSDEGPGIPEQYRETIFDKFGQVDIEGHYRQGSTGLGLTFCKLAIEAHGGKIGVDSIVSEGSTFWFTLPLVSPIAETVVRAPEPSEVEAGVCAG